MIGSSISMPVAELIIGGVSLVAIISTFETAFKLYNTLVDSTGSAGNDARVLGVKLFLEQQRFELYGDYVGILGKKDGLLLRQLPMASQKVVLTVKDELEALLSDTAIFQTKYGISRTDLEKGATSSQDHTTQPNQPGLSISLPNTNNLPQGGLNFETPKLNIARKVLWVWRDNKKVLQLHQHLRDLNDSLWATVTLHHLSNMQKALPSFVLPGINNIETLSEIRESAVEEGRLPITAECVDMRRSAILPLHEMERLEVGSKLKISRQYVIKTKPCNGTQENRFEGLLTKGASSIQVLIEYKATQLTEAEAMGNARARIKELAFQLSEKRDEDLCLFQCEGYFEESHVPPKFALVYRVSGSAGYGIISLSELLADRKSINKVDLGQRFALAQALCYALLQWHASGWLHKNINTENIVFPKNSWGEPLLAAPKLLGFGSSRPDKVTEESITEFQNDGPVEWFRHPAYQQPEREKFHRSYDYYSLGVVLLAIGWWVPVETLSIRFVEKQPAAAKDPTLWAQFLVARVETSMGASCGNIYRDVVLRCLRGDFGLDDNAHVINRDTTAREWQRAFLFTIVRELARCVA